MKKFSLAALGIFLFTSLVFSQNLSQAINSSSLLKMDDRHFTYGLNEKPTPDYANNALFDLKSNYGIEYTRIDNKSVQSQLSTLWTVVTLNMITADLLGLFIPESMAEWTEFADGKEKEIMMGGAIMYQIPISMVFLSRVLPYKANRISNIIAAGAMTAAVIAGGSKDPHYIVCAGAEVVWMSLIAYKAIKWKNPESIAHNFGLNLNPGKNSYGLSYSYKF